ncbi:hypothetical protein KP79_PYT01242 [Mizuhopecten yessoensis]|uniref:Uncharacterized protein n=1 Tax=Mizuhopecten yessoensis TaxID=6573 RepID=A0A210QHE2_MIZYE|nr:hypothetical protein KP79_PYT01242 [Mizuhopecten yessoensis]
MHEEVTSFWHRGRNSHIFYSNLPPQQCSKSINDKTFDKQTGGNSPLYPVMSTGVSSLQQTCQIEGTSSTYLYNIRQSGHLESEYQDMYGNVGIGSNIHV